MTGLLSSPSIDFRCSSPPIRTIDSYTPSTKFDASKMSLLEDRIAQKDILIAELQKSKSDLKRELDIAY